MDTHASFPVELRKAAVVAEEETKARSFYLHCLPELTHQRRCLGICINWREQQNKF